MPKHEMMDALRLRRPRRRSGRTLISRMLDLRGVGAILHAALLPLSKKSWGSVQISLPDEIDYPDVAFRIVINEGTPEDEERLAKNVIQTLSMVLPLNDPLSEGVKLESVVSPHLSEPQEKARGYCMLLAEARHLEIRRSGKFCLECDGLGYLSESDVRPSRVNYTECSWCVGVGFCPQCGTRGPTVPNFGPCACAWVYADPDMAKPASQELSPTRRVVSNT